jgi:hypothetical protein
VAESLDEHMAQLSTSLARGSEADPRSVGFVKAFVRPLGLEREAARELAAGIEELGTLQRSAAAEPGRADRVWRAVLVPVAALVAMAERSRQRHWWTLPVRAAIALYVGCLWLRYGVPEALALHWRRTWRRVSRAGRETRYYVVRTVDHAQLETRRAIQREWTRMPRRWRTFRKQYAQVTREVGKEIRTGSRRVRKRVTTARHGAAAARRRAVRLAKNPRRVLRVGRTLRRHARASWSAARRAAHHAKGGALRALLRGRGRSGQFGGDGTSGAEVPHPGTVGGDKTSRASGDSVAGT